MILKKPAVKIKQGDLTIYATSLKVKDLLIKNFFKIDKLDSGNENSGFQRVTEDLRVNRLADYILEAWEDGDAFLPTSIFLATDKDVKFDSSKNIISFNIEDVGPFNVVDGQHRVKGLIEAAKKNPKVGEFELIANIAVNLDEISQMCHFLIVNTTQKAVATAVEQQIVSRLTSMVDIEVIPTLPRWIQRKVSKGEDREALIITNYLNSEKDSPWLKKITMANESKESTNTIQQHSFVQLIKSYILSSNNPLSSIQDSDKRNKILKNYWKAIADLLIDPTSEKQSVIFKTIGLELFASVSPTVFNKLFVDKDFTVANVKKILQHGFRNLPNDHLSMQDPEWWQTGNGASTMNKAAVRQVATALNKAINFHKSTDNIKL